MSYTRFFEKSAKLRMEDIEDNIGTYFNDRDEQYIRKLVQEQEAKRWALRHPVLSLGIGHAISKNKAVDEITRGLVRKNVDYRNAYLDAKHKRTQYALAQQRNNIELLKANAMTRQAFNNTKTAALDRIAGKLQERFIELGLM